MKKFLGNYNILILALIVIVDIALYLTNIISVIAYLIIAVGGFFLVTWAKASHTKDINNYLENDLNPDKFIEELEKYEKFNNYGKQKINLYIAKMIAYAEKGDWETVKTLLAKVKEKNYSRDFYLAFNVHVFNFSYYMHREKYEDAEEQLAEMGETLDILEKKDKKAFSVFSAAYDVLDAEHDFYSAKGKKEKETYFTAFEIQEKKLINRDNSKRTKLKANYNLGKGSYIMQEYNKAKEHFEEVIATNGKVAIVENSKNYIKKI